MITHGEPRIGVVVVAFNATSTLISTLDRIPEAFLARLSEVIILDDASHDDTVEKAREWAERQPDVTSVVVRHKKNLGYGGNQKAAYALASQRGLDVVVMLHGDGQYDPAYLPEMVQPLLDDECEAVFGSRMMVRGAARAGGMPLYKRLGNRVLTRFENRLLGTDLSEFHSGYRAYSVRALDTLPLAHNTDDFDFDTQIIVQLIDRRMRIKEIPIPTFYGDEICRVNGMKYAGDVVRDVLEYRMAKVGFGTAMWVPDPGERAFVAGDGSSRAEVLSMLEDREPCRILEIGCGQGSMAQNLRERGHQVTGIDAIEILGVRDRVDRFFRADLTEDLAQEIGDGYDVVIAVDVLDGLPRPQHLLGEMQRVLAAKGQILMSVPNVSHWYPRARMATGGFGYDRRGPLDEGHLRFFTRRSIHRLVRGAGFDVLDEVVTGTPISVVDTQDRAWSRRLRRADTALARLHPQLFAYQFVLRLTPHAEGTDVVVYESPGLQEEWGLTSELLGVVAP